jgi:hypothetical protein
LSFTAKSTTQNHLHSYHAGIHAATTSDERMSNNTQQIVAVVKDYYFQRTPKKEKPIYVQFLFTDS